MKNFILVVALSLSLQAVGQTLEDLTRQRVETGETPGIAVATIENGKVSYYSFGKANVAGNQSVTSQTLFEIGSITKTFTCSMFSYLCGQKEMQPADLAQRYLPEGMTLPDRNGKQITLLHLASAHSGLPRMPNNFSPADPANPYIDYTEKELAAFLNKTELIAEPGRQYEYSNLGMGLLGFIMTQHKHQTYAALVQQTVLKPLGMSNTFISGERQDARLAIGYNDGTPVKAWTWGPQSVLTGAGGLVSNTEDMIKYLQAQLADDNDALTTAFKTAHHEVAEAIGTTIQIGMGWHITNHRFVWHNGGTGGFRTFAGFDPQTKRAIVILTNSTTGADDLGFHWLDATSPLKTLRKAVELDAAKLKEYEGVYQLNPTFKITVTANENHLTGQASGQPAFSMYNDSTDRFYLKVVAATIQFERDADGKVIRLKLNQNGTAREGKKIR